MQDPARANRLRFHCRRGMKELDVLLERFLDAPDVRLDDGQWPELESLLAIEDDRLWDWLQNPDAHGARPYRSLLVRIRDG